MEVYLLRKKDKNPAKEPKKYGGGVVEEEN